MANTTVKKLFSQYLVNRGIWGGFLIFALYLVSGAALLATDIWLGVWSSKSYNFSTDTYLYVYMGLAIGSAVLIIPRDLIFRSYIRANMNKRYRELFDTLIHAKMNFF